MSCCTNTYDLGCLDYCGSLSFGSAENSGTYVGVFKSGNTSVKQSITVTSGNPFVFDLSLLNENAEYILNIYRNGTQIDVTIDEVAYDCFRLKTEILGISQSVEVEDGCTAMCAEIYDPEDVGADVFDYNNLHTYAVGDGVTITGNGTTENPFTYIGSSGGGYMFPNGGAEVSSSRSFQSSDAGKVLEITGNNVTLTMPSVFPFNNKETFAVINLGSGNKFNTEYNGYLTDLLGGANENEALMFLADTATSSLFILNSGRITDGSDLKTISKYLYDNLGVPYTGATQDIDLGTHGLEATKVRANGSGGLTLEASNGTDVGVLGLANTANVEWYGSHNFSGATQDTIAAFVGSGKTLSSLGLATYPSLTELSYVKGVTSSIQTQIGNKQDALVSGTNIKSLSINAGTQYSLLGSGNLDITVSSGAALSSLTAATGSNTINNVANAQEWQWNSLAGGIGLKLSSNSTIGTNNNTILDITNSGTIIAGQTTYGARITHSKVSSGGANIALDINVSGSSTGNGIKITNSCSGGAGIELVAGMAGHGIQMNSNRFLLRSSTEYIQSNGSLVEYNSGSLRTYIINSGTSNYVCYGSSQTDNFLTLNRVAAGSFAIGFNTDYFSSNYRAVTTATNVIKSANGILEFTANTGLSGGFANYTPTTRLCVKPTGAINITPITATAASAITPAEGDIVMVSNTNGTFTSIGFWGYQNGSWQKM